MSTRRFELVEGTPSPMMGERAGAEGIFPSWMGKGYVRTPGLVDYPPTER